MDSPSTSEFQLLLTRLAAGDTAARDLLLVRTQERIRRLASKILHADFARVDRFEDTGDVVQNMTFRLIKSWDSVVTGDDGNPLVDVGQYLSRTSRLIREVLLDMARQHYGRGGNRPRQVSLNRDDTSTDGPALHDPGTDTLDPERVTLFSEFHAAVETLPEHYRRVVDLHWYQELPHHEVGQLMGIAEPTVRKYWVGARLQLQKQFEGNPFEWFAG